MDYIDPNLITPYKVKRFLQDESSSNLKYLIADWREENRNITAALGIQAIQVVGTSMTYLIVKYLSASLQRAWGAINMHSSYWHRLPNERFAVQKQIVESSVLLI